MKIQKQYVSSRAAAQAAALLATPAQPGNTGKPVACCGPGRTSNPNRAPWRVIPEGNDMTIINLTQLQNFDGFTTRRNLSD